MNQHYFDVPFAFSGDVTAIPDPLQTGGTVSFTEGWNYNYQRDLATDPAALPIDRSTMNWLLLQITTALQALQQTGCPEFILASQNGGAAYSYAKGTVVLWSASGNAPFTKYVSLTAGNTNTPSVGDPQGLTTGWQIVVDPISTAAQATAGTDDASIMTPLKVAQQTALRALLAGNASQVFNVGPAVSPTQAPQLQQVQSIAALQGIGQCRLSVTSGTVLTLAPYNGQNISIGGTQYAIPAGGVTLSNAGLQGQVTTSSYSVASNVATYVTATAHGLAVGSRVYLENTALGANGSYVVTAVGSSTQFSFAFTHANVSSTADTGGTVQPVFYAYAAAPSGTVVLQASQIGYTVQPNGIATQTGNTAFTLVGMFMLNGGNFTDSISRRWCLNWFNRRIRRAAVYPTGPFTYSAQSVGILDNSLTVRFLCWADDQPQGQVVGQLSLNSGGPSASLFSGVLALDAFNNFYGPANGIASNATYLQQVVNTGTLDPSVNTVSAFEGGHSSLVTGLVGINGGTYTISNIQHSVTVLG